MHFTYVTASASTCGGGGQKMISYLVADNKDQIQKFLFVRHGVFE
jgi:hypothetical protein